ncbi:PA14 domain-containing protein [Aeoliella sp. SH292]|uniref:PA14 domain-containing protein n=1 Tax=Aeoliella sp. SH292 TaxID=3454464 RepID=UPI003F9BFA7F
MLATSPNIVLVMTDDQRLDTMFAMPITQQLIGGTGTTFENAYTVTSFCCPSRSSMLTGQYVHNHGTVGNDEPQGGFEGFDDSSTLATWLQDAGYRTGLYGKYLNGYYETSPRNADPNNMYVPPGWDEWHAFLGSSFYNFDISANGVYTEYPGANYSTDVLADLASDFIETGETNDDQPFFLFYSVKAPHTPANPAQRHNSEFDDIEPYRPPSFNEADVSDKPAYVRNQAPLTTEDIAIIDQFRENQLESLLVVDEAVGQLVESLQANGEWDNTIFVFMSDSGIQWGEHRWDVKGTAYEETIRIPMIIRDGRDPVQRTSDPYALTIDIAPTLLEYAGVSVSDHIDGESLVPLITGQDPTWRTDFIVEHLNIGSQPTSIALRSGDWSYNEYSNGERELYNLATDPYQMQSLHNDPAYASIMSQLSVRLQELKSQDTQAPQITNVTVTPNTTNEGSITIKATVSDVNTGSSEVRMPTFHIDSLGGIPQGFAMYPDDGLFDSVTENVTAVISPEAFAALSVGTHTIYVRGRDTAANWSSAVTATFTKTAEAPTQSYLSISPPSISGFEGDAEFVIYEFVVSHTGVVTSTSTVDFTVVGTGSSPADAQDFGGSFPVGTVMFAPGETTQVLSILVSGDTLPELDEAFQVVLSNPSVNTNLQSTMASGLIRNDEQLEAAPGLKGEYFNDVALTEFVSTRTDSTVNFTSGWNGGPPGTGVTADQNYSVRWSGEVEIAAGGAWTFYTTTNDGVRLWIDDQLVIDDWNVHIALENSGTVNLTAGWHRIRLEYFQQGGGAVATLSFAGPGQTKAVVPQSRLRTASIPEPVAPVFAIAAASASKAEGNADFTPYTFTVTRTQNTTGALTVDYLVTGSGGNAANAADFGGSVLSGTLAFAPGESSKTLTVLVAGDSAVEVDETFVVTLVNASGGAEISTATAAGVILNDDVTTPATEPGLKGEYFNSTSLTNLATTRVDQSINFTSGWNSTPPGTTVTGDANYSIRWTGQVETPTAGNWTFFTTSNDGVRLWIDDQLVIDNWTTHIATENSGTLNLSAGWHSIRMEYFQQGGAAVATLSFQGPDQAKAIVPTSRLRTGASTPPPGPTGDGLEGQYYNSTNLTGLASTRVDSSVNFTTGWNASPAGSGVTADAQYSVRWTGFVETPAAGDWTFYTTSNDGVRLWINEQLVIDNWTTHAATENSGTIALDAGWHSIRLEYFQQCGAAIITLSYQGPGQTKAIIPQARLSSTQPGAPMVLQVLSYSGEEQIDQPYVAHALSEGNGSARVDPLLIEASADQVLLAELRRARTSRRDASRLIEPDQAFDAVFAELGEGIFGPLWID